jgi:hypothetical protein
MWQQGKAREGKARHGEAPDIVQVCVHKRNQARVVLALAIENLVHRHFLTRVHSSGSRLRIVCVNAKIYMAEKVGVFMMMFMRGVLGVMVGSEWHSGGVVVVECVCCDRR